MTPPNQAMHGTPTEATVLWTKVLANLKEHIAPNHYADYFTETWQQSFDGRLLLVSVPSSFHRRWLMSNVECIYDALMRLGYDEELDVEFRVRQPTDAVGSTTSSGSWSGNGANASNGAGYGGAPSGAFGAAASSSAALAVPQLNPKYSFENFVIGENSRFAHAAALKLSNPNSRAFNPLFLYGGVGLGKTHLLHAIGHRLLELQRDARVVYVSSETFMNAFIEAITKGHQMEFRNLYRNVDLLLIDDVQFFVDKERTQTEFFHTFNALYESGRKIVLSSDRQPKELAPLEERLRSRFEWGLIVDIQVPDLETRMAILQKKAALEQMGVPNDVIYYIAEHIQSNVRELESALLRLKAFSSMERRPIDLQMCTDLLSHLIYSAETADSVSIERIQECVCTYFDIALHELVGPSRQKRYAVPRHVAQYLSRKLTGLSYPEIGAKFGGRDHTSVMHAFRKIEKEIDSDARLANCVNYITKQIRSGMDNTPRS